MNRHVSLSRIKHDSAPVEIVLLGNLKMYLDVTIVEVTDSKTPYTAISKKVVRKKFARGNPERYYGI